MSRGFKEGFGEFPRGFWIFLRAFQSISWVFRDVSEDQGVFRDIREIARGIGGFKNFQSVPDS